MDEAAKMLDGSQRLHSVRTNLTPRRDLDLPPFLVRWDGQSCIDLQTVSFLQQGLPVAGPGQCYQLLILSKDSLLLDKAFAL